MNKTILGQWVVAALLAACGALKTSPEQVSPAPAEVPKGEHGNTANPDVEADATSVVDAGKAAEPITTVATGRPVMTPAAQILVQEASSTEESGAANVSAEASSVGRKAIRSFTASPATINPGESYTLSWDITDGLPILCQISTSTMRAIDPDNCEQVPLTGSKVITTSPDARLGQIWQMHVSKSGSQDEVAFVTVYLTCPDPWSFSPAPPGCPLNGGLTTQASAGAAQRFERGLMIWVAELDEIFILYDTPQPPSWEGYPDEWEEGMMVEDPSVQPPAGLYEPIRGFGAIWRRSSLGFWYIRERLGWATGQEFSMDTFFQCGYKLRSDRGRFLCYLQGPDGVIALEKEGSGWYLWTGTIPPESEITLHH